jgi:hypothetical protein
MAEIRNAYVTSTGNSLRKKDVERPRQNRRITLTGPQENNKWGR